MADLSHLERMGRELKCPICLSLLNSAVSLACNHVFCNLCIMKSMKSGSTCPVCKVPYRRREVRPAPHMDNLVSIYKNMEVASGVDLFVTQAAQPTRLSDGVNKPDVVATEDGVLNKRSSKGKRRRRTNNPTLENSSPAQVKPSCPTKKRVQVPQHPSTETTTHCADPDNVLIESNTDGPKNISAESEKNPPLNKKGEQAFMPFFWLREEEDAEKPTQNSDKDQPTTSPLKVPTFSDLKDSEDETPSPSTKEVHGASAALNFFDSEMFEWTQRPCSPELCSSPLQLKVSDNKEKDSESAFKESVSAEAVNTIKKRGRAAQVKSQRNSLKGDIEQDKAPGGCRKENMRAAKRLANRRVKGASSAVLTTTMKENNYDILDGSTRSYDAMGSSKSKKTKKLCEVSIPMDKDSCALPKKRKVDPAIAKSESSNARKKKFGPVPKFNQESNVINNLPSSSHAADTELILHKCKTTSKKIQCAFCQSSESSEASGEMVHYCDGNPVSADYADGSRVIHSHKNCVEWAPNVYFEGDKAINLEAELARSKRISCCCCGIKGAALGCFEKSCRKSFHVTCAKMIPQCRWDNVNFVVLCPLHVSSKLPVEAKCDETRKTSGQKERQKNTHVQVPKSDETGNCSKRKSNGLRDKMVLCCSSLSAAERELVSKIERSARVTVLQKWDSRVTHVIASTDENGACKRTLKVLMGILEGKWILSVEWIRACMEATSHVDEEKYEIKVDVHGMRDGPRLGRLRVLNKQPKLFEGMKFYFAGDFVSSYRGYLQDLVIAAGGAILHRKPVTGDEEKIKASTFIVYNLEIADKPRSGKDTILKQKKSEAEALAASTGAKLVSNSWILNSIAACKLQGLEHVKY